MEILALQQYPPIDGVRVQADAPNMDRSVLSEISSYTAIILIFPSKAIVKDVSNLFKEVFSQYKSTKKITANGKEIYPSDIEDILLIEKSKEPEDK